MRVIDAIGNSIMVGQKLYWKQADLYVTVKDIQSVNDDRIAMLKLELDMGVEEYKNKPTPFPMFIRVVDPASEETALKAMGAH